MTNAQIIFIESQKLAEQGIINYTGRTYKAVNMKGEEVEVKETEAIHTFAGWKELGFCVKKGEKAKAKIIIWKHTSKVDEETGKEKDVKMFMKNSSFFSQSQVEPLKKDKTA